MILLNNNLRENIFFWKTSGGAVIGRAHEKRGMPCQDYVAYGYRNGISVIVLADGAGSCLYSHIGADVATKTTFNYLYRNFEKIYTSKAECISNILIDKILAEITKEKEKINYSNLDDFASTLLFVALYQKKFIAGHLGDGVIAYTTKDSQAKVLSTPTNGEYTNQTYFITSKHAKNMLRLFRGKTNNINSFLLMSDGAARCFYNDSKQTLTRGVITLSKWVAEKCDEEAKETIDGNLEKIIKMKTFDDCSLAVMSKIAVNCNELEIMDQSFHKKFLELESNKEIEDHLKVYKELKKLKIVKNSSYKTILKRLDLNKRKVRTIVKRLKRNGYVK